MAFLNDVESYIQERPDSALAVLENIDRKTLAGTPVKAKYSLLYTMALDKNYIDVTSDSLTSVALKWYRRHGSADEKLKAYYYNGRVFENAGEWERAMENYFEAERYAKKADDKMQVALIYTAKAYIYEGLFRFEEAIKNMSAASDIYLSLDEIGRYISAQITLSSLYYSLIDLGKSEESLSIIENFLRDMNDNQKGDYYAMRLNLANAKMDNIEKIIIEYLNNTNGDSFVNWMVVAKSYMLTNQFNLGLEALKKFRYHCPQYGSIPNYFLVESELYRLIGEYEKSLISYKYYVNVQDDTDVAIFNSDAKFVEDKKIAEYKLHNRNLWIALLSMGVLVFAFAGALMYYVLKERIRKKQIEQKELEQEKIRLEQEKESYRALYEMAKDEQKNLQKLRSKSKLDKQVLQSVEERLEVLNGFITASITQNRSVSAKEALNDYLNNKKRFLESTRFTFLATHPKFIAFLNKSGLSEDEISYCCLYCMGMNGSDIASYLGRKSFYNDSSAIRKKIGLSSRDTNLDNYLREKLHSLG